METCKVLVTLWVEPTQAVRHRLESVGLHIELVTGTILAGRVPEAAVDALRADPAVRDVERSQRLEPHSAGAR